MVQTAWLRTQPRLLLVYEVLSLYKLGNCINPLQYKLSTDVFIHVGSLLGKAFVVAVAHDNSDYMSWDTGYFANLRRLSQLTSK